MLHITLPAFFFSFRSWIASVRLKDQIGTISHLQQVRRVASIILLLNKAGGRGGGGGRSAPFIHVFKFLKVCNLYFKKLQGSFLGKASNTCIEMSVRLILEETSVMWDLLSQFHSNE